jgi:transcription initiation factor IIF auxiliary subunit
MKKRALVLVQMIGLIAAWYVVVTISSPAAQELSFSNTSRYLCDGRWEWTVFIQALPEVLTEIKHVEYKLHPTFPNPVQKVDSLGDQRYPFGLTRTGWGVFEISIRVVFKNRRVHPLKHMLTFEAQPVKDSLPIGAGNVATQMGKGLWSWTVFIQASDEVLNRIQCVEYKLHPTFSDPVQEVSERGTGPYAFALSATGWGTFQIKIRVFLKDGQAQELVHNLKF